jgi:hypothetical protein
LDKGEKRFSEAQQFLIEMAVKMGLVDEWREGNPPAGFYAREAADNFRDGKLITEYLHARPITSEMAAAIEEKSYQGKGASKAETEILEEYYRTALYEVRKEQIGAEEIDQKVLYLASGADGILGFVFGKDNVTMLSHERGKYFDQYYQWLQQIEPEPKLQADFYRVPVADHSFSTIVLNEIDVFDAHEMTGFDKHKDDGQSRRRFFTELRRVIDENNGKAIITNFDLLDSHLPPSHVVPEDMKTLLTECGWSISRNFDFHGNSCCELVPSHAIQNGTESL